MTTTSEHLDRNQTIEILREELNRRSDRTWSVKGGRGTSWGWITVTAPPKRLDEYGGMTEDDQVELGFLLGLDTVHHQGVSIPAQSDYYAEYADRAKGYVPRRCGVPNWD